LKSISLLLLVFQVSSLCATEPASNAPAGAPNVSYERLARAIDEPQNWLTYWGDYPGTRFRNLTQINDANVKHLRVEWIYQTEQQATETVPLVVDGAANSGVITTSSQKTPKAAVPLSTAA
jgi:glucose dehydrogenase